MPCMCGDPGCGSCGPAQGYYPCIICRVVADECEHVDPETGELKEEFKAEAERIYQAELESEKELANEYTGNDQTA